MRRTVIIAISIAVYIVLMIGMFFYVDDYIKSKDIRLHNEISEKVDKIFSHQSQFVDISYSDKNVHYNEIEIPINPYEKGNETDITLIDKLLKGPSNKGKESNIKYKKDLKNSHITKWDRIYGDLSKLYMLDYLHYSLVAPNGWCLNMVEKRSLGVVCTWIFPYAVGFKKQYSYPDSYESTSVKQAVLEAFDFYTNDNASKYSKSLVKGCYKKIWSELLYANNEYYFLGKDSKCNYHWTGEDLFELNSFNKVESPYKEGCVYGSYYKVFIASSQPVLYTIQKRDFNPDKIEKTHLQYKWSLILTLLLLVVIIPLIYLELKHKK